MNIDWRVFALGSAGFAALTAIFGKVGVSNLNSNLATLFRSVIILAVTALIVSSRNEWQRPDQVSLKSVVFLTLSE
jgi:transporter family protein